MNFEIQRNNKGNAAADISDNYEDEFDDDEEIPESLPSDSE
jgi:hypothetical protein